MILPPLFHDWFARQGWQPHPHQLALLAAQGDSLLIAPTGGGKTLAGFLPSLVELARAAGPDGYLENGESGRGGLHTLYVSPLKALTADIRRNLARPVAELGLAIRVEDRTGDTGQTQRRRQRVDPPHVLLTTPESLALMLSYPEAPAIFGGLRRVVLDELHALAESKRGDQLMLGLARLRRLSPALRVTGLSATVEDPQALAGFMAGARPVEIVEADPGPDPDIAMLATARPAPLAGSGGRYAIPEVLEAVKAARTTNLTARQTWVHVVLPQAVPPMIPAMANYVLAMFKETPLLSAITVMELMGQARSVANSTYRYVEPITLVGVCFLIVSIISVVGLRWLERRFGRFGK